MKTKEGNMKKIIAIALSVFILQACDNDGQPATQNDGMTLGDTNGGLADTAFGPQTPLTDTSKMENRVDLSQRDTFQQTPR